MKKLIQGIVEFRKQRTEEMRTLFAKLALGQRPDVLMIACSDSRVVPNLFASTNPGDLFVMRNVGNLVPPATASAQDASVAASIEFAVNTLQVKDIIICGHSECGAIQALVNGLDTLCCPHVKSWLSHGQESLHKLESGGTLNSSLLHHNQLSQINVLQQMHHLTTYPLIKEKLEKNELRIHGWWFDIAGADVYCYEKSKHQFVLIDDVYAATIMERLH